MRKYLILAAIALACISCSKKEAIGDGAGCFSLTVNVEGEAVTKAAMTSAELLQNARLNIYYADFSGLVRTYKYSEAPSKIYLPTGEYRLDVIAGEAAKSAPAGASWEQKSYKGSTPFTITNGCNLNLVVTANVTNAISKVTFDQTVADNFQAGYTLTIGTSEECSLTYDASKNEAQGYFIISGLTDPEFNWTFDGLLAKDGSAFTKNGTIEGIEAGKVYSLSLKYTVKDGSAVVDLYVDYSTDALQDIIVFEAASTGMSTSSIYEVWAGHATLHADVDESEFDDPDKVFFAWSADGTNWTQKLATRVSEGTYETTATGLAPDTNYSCKLVIDGVDMGDPIQVTTDKAPAVPNGGFEYSSTSQSGKFTEFYDPSCSDVPSRTAWWGSGNGSAGISGSADFGGFIICKPDTDVKYAGNQSACLQSTWALVKFAAGNLFSGYFGGLVGTNGGKVYFGRPFTGRPTAVRVYLKYSAGKVNRINSYPEGETVTTSDYDRARIQVAVGDWNNKTYGGTKESPILVNTTEPSTFVDFNTDAATIAYGELILQSADGNPYNSWVQYTIPLNYKDTNRFPTHIVISMASSMLGDYFTGCDSSKLWVDNFELVYE